MIKIFKYLVPFLGAIGLGYLATEGTFGANVETAATIGVSTLSPMLAMVVDILKNGMPGMVVKKATTKIVETIGEDEANILFSVIKEKGVQWLLDQIQEGFSTIKGIEQYMPLLLAIGTKMNENGAFDETPLLKETVEGTIDNVNNK
jgi:hypothetical protein